MPPKSAQPITCFLLKFNKTTTFVPIQPTSTTLSSLRTAFLEALTLSRPPSDADTYFEAEPEVLPSKAEDIGLWRSMEGDEWELLKDEKGSADKWGLNEAAVIGVSFKVNGKFPTPSLIIPVDFDDEGLDA